MAFRDSKLSGLLDFLDSQEASHRFDSVLEEPEEVFSDYSAVKVKLMNLKLDLDESNKIIDSLRLVVDKQKFENEELERFWKDKLKRELEIQQKNYEETIEKNLSFIENLVKDKEQKLALINELQGKLARAEENYKQSVNSLNEQWKREMKKGKDSWVTTEKVKREKWEKEKVKEIKEMTARGLEPEINRIVSEHRRLVEEKDESHRKEIKSLKEFFETKHAEEIKKIRDNLNYKHDQVLEKERENFTNRIKELTESQEAELKTIRNRWNQELIDERNRLESYYQEEIKIWKAK